MSAVFGSVGNRGGADHHLRPSIFGTAYFHDTDLYCQASWHNPACDHHRGFPVGGRSHPAAEENCPY